MLLHLALQEQQKTEAHQLNFDLMVSEIIWHGYFPFSAGATASVPGWVAVAGPSGGHEPQS